MIDLQKLKQFPLAFKAFEGYIEKQLGSVLFIYNGSNTVRNEDIILFLDEKHVFICICGSRSFWPCTVTSYFLNQESNYERVESGKTRTESTELSLLKAFELLETKLKTN